METRLLAPDSEAWRESLRHLEHDFYHLPEYAQLEAEQVGGQAIAILVEHDGYRLFLPLILRSLPNGLHVDTADTSLLDAVSPYGYPGPLDAGPPGAVDEPARQAFLDEAVTAILAELRRLNVVSAFVRIHSFFHPPLDTLAKHGTLRRHGETVAIDLGLPTVELERQVRAGHRSEIARARAAGYTVEMDTEWRDFRSFMEHYQETMRRVGAEAAYFFGADYLEGLRSALGPRIHLCVARLGGEVAGAALFTECNGVVQYHLSATAEAHLRARPSKLILDFARSWARERGNRYLHLGGGLGAKKDGLFEFKAGFSPLRFPFWSWRLVPDPAAYQQLTEAWERASGAKADGPDGFFPAYRKQITTSLSA